MFLLKKTKKKHLKMLISFPDFFFNLAKLFLHISNLLRFLFFLCVLRYIIIFKQNEEDPLFFILVYLYVCRSDEGRSQ